MSMNCNEVVRLSAGEQFSPVDLLVRGVSAVSWVRIRVGQCDSYWVKTVPQSGCVGIQDSVGPARWQQGKEFCSGWIGSLVIFSALCLHWV